MKILMISESFLPVTGGLQYQLKYLTEEMANQNIGIFLMSYSDGENFLQKNNTGFPIFIKIKNRNFLSNTWEILKNIRRISPNIIHVHSAEKSAFQVSLLKKFHLIKTPFIVTSHGVDIMTYPSIGYGLRLHKILALVVKFILKTCDMHTIVGKSMLPYALEAGSDAKKIIEINNGVPEKIKFISESNFELIMKKFDIKSDDFILLSLSGMRPLKGIDILINSVKLIKKEISNVKVLLACESFYDKEMKKMVRDLKLEDTIKFIGFITNEEEKISLIRRCDVFCKPSRLEACSVALLEAMQEGRVVVATEAGGMDIIKNEIDGFLVKNEDFEDFAKAVIRIFKDRTLRNKIEKNAKLNISNFHISKTTSDYIKLYEKIINAK